MMHVAFAQNQRVEMIISLDAATSVFDIDQSIFYTNHSQDTLDNIVLQDWNHAFSDKDSPLGKRFLENYSNKFYFTSDKNRGYTDIKSLHVENQSLMWHRDTMAIDQIHVKLLHPLRPKQTVKIDIQYKLKLPHTKFTGYGKNKEGFHLKNWYLIPAVYKDRWKPLSHLDIDNYNHDLTDFNVLITLPQELLVSSNLEVIDQQPEFLMQGKGVTNFDLEILYENEFNSFNLKGLQVATNLNNIEISDEVKHNILQRQYAFLQKNIGDVQVPKIFVNEIDYNKNPLYGFNQLPSFLRPFSDAFEWDIRMFKTFTDSYLDLLVPMQKRTNNWYVEGLKFHLMRKYVDTYYADQKLIGNISKIWGVRTYHFSDLAFNERYYLGGQYVLRSRLDQSLETSQDSLTNYNKQVGQPFKTVQLFQYLELQLGVERLNELMQESLKQPSEVVGTFFIEQIKKETDKTVHYYLDELLSNTPRMDVKILKKTVQQDSIILRVKQNCKVSPPLLLSGIENDSVKYRSWVQLKSGISELKVPNNTDYQWFLDKEKALYDVTHRNNTILANKGLFKKPLKIKWLIDAEDETKTQLFFEPGLYYNFYDGITLTNTFHNKSIWKKDFVYRLMPSYSFKSNELTGGMRLEHWKYFEKSKFRALKTGLAASYFHYKPQLSYSVFSGYANLFFKRKNLRKTKTKLFNISYVQVNRDRDPEVLDENQYDKYGVINLNYVYSNPELLNKMFWNTGVEISSEFAKLNNEFIFRKLIGNNQQFETRFFNGIFLFNNTTGDFFSYGVNKPNDYLFRYKYFGRSESTGILSQQFIMNDGGFKADMPVKYASQWISSMNMSLGIWKWAEFYTDLGLVKNKGVDPYFVHDKGLRLNFVNNMLELYFPVHSNNGWEISQPHYETKIRFVLTTDFKVIFAYLKRGVM
jgi:hypothetical protein